MSNLSNIVQRLEQTTADLRNMKEKVQRVAQFPQRMRNLLQQIETAAQQGNVAAVIPLVQAFPKEVGEYEAAFKEFGQLLS